jgi:hypothetical protein
MNARSSPAVPPWVPTEMLAMLDLSELAPGDVKVREECFRLGALLGAHVAAYDRGAEGRPRGLCSYYRASDLTPTQVNELRLAELIFPEVAFVAYRSPLELLPR